MVRSNWARIAIVGLASASLTWGQSPAPPAWAPPSSAIVTVQEPGKTARQCQVLRTWREPDGRERQELQAIDTGEVFTLDRPAATPVLEKVVRPASSVSFLTPPPECIITVTENGKDIKCKPVKSWLEPDGSQAYLVRVIESDELLTLVEMAAENSADKQPSNVRTTRIFHWGKSNVSPPGAPVPPDIPVVNSIPAEAVPSPVVVVPTDVHQPPGPAVEIGKPEPNRPVPPEVNGRILAATPPAPAAPPAPQEKSVMSRLFRWDKASAPPPAKRGHDWVGAPAKQKPGQQPAPVAAIQVAADVNAQSHAALQAGKGPKEPSATSAQPQVAAASWTAPAPPAADRGAPPGQPKELHADSWHPTASSQGVPKKEGRGFFSFLRKDKVPQTPEPIAPPTPLVVGRPVPKGAYASRAKPASGGGRVEPAFLPPPPVRASQACFSDDSVRGVEYPQPTDWRESWRNSPPMPRATELGGSEPTVPAFLTLPNAEPKPPPDPVPSEMAAAKPKVTPAVVKGSSFQAEAPPAVTKGLLVAVNDKASAALRVPSPKDDELRLRKSVVSPSGSVQRVSALEHTPEIRSRHWDSQTKLVIDGSSVAAVAKQLSSPESAGTPPSLAKRLPPGDPWSPGSSAVPSHAAWLPEGHYAASLPPATTPSSLPPMTGNQSVLQAGDSQVAFVPIATVPQGPPPAPPNPGPHVIPQLPPRSANASPPPPQPLSTKTPPAKPSNAFSDVPSSTPSYPQQVAPGYASMRNPYYMPGYYYPSTTPSYPYAMYPAAPYAQANPYYQPSAGYPGNGFPAGPSSYSPGVSNAWRQPWPQVPAYPPRASQAAMGPGSPLPAYDPALMGQVTYLAGRNDRIVYPPFQANPMAASVPLAPPSQLQTVGYQPASGTYQTPEGGLPGQPLSYASPPGTGASGHSSAQPLLTILRDSVCFTDREWAADKLVHIPTQQVKEALLASCYGDPAPTVKVACIRSLTAMGANSTDVIQVLQALQAHEDVRVRHEAEQALRRLTPQ